MFEVLRVAEDDRVLSVFDFVDVGCVLEDLCDIESVIIVFYACCVDDCFYDGSLVLFGIGYRIEPAVCFVDVLEDEIGSLGSESLAVAILIVFAY